MSLIFSFVLALSQAALAQPAPLNFPSTGIKKIEVSIPKGSISITNSKTQKDISVSVKRKNVNDEKKCLQTIEIQDTVLVVKVASENKLFNKSDCDYIASVVVPAAHNVNLDISSGTGAITIKDINGAMNITTGTGNVKVAADVLKDVNVKTGTGSLDFHYKTCSGRADIDIISGTAKTTIELPETCKIRVDYTSGVGKLFNGIGESETFDVKIKATTGTGDLSIVKSGK